MYEKNLRELAPDNLLRTLFEKREDRLHVRNVFGPCARRHRRAVLQRLRVYIREHPVGVVQGHRRHAISVRGEKLVQPVPLLRSRPGMQKRMPEI